MTIDAQILSALRGAEDESVSGGELSQRLGISRAAIWARIEELRSLGYEIEASPHKGYRLRNVPDVLHADDLLSRLGQSKVVGRDIRVFQETTSTNDVIEKLASDGVVAPGFEAARSDPTNDCGRDRLGPRHPPGNRTRARNQMAQ
jgi:BirA family biotin operon repressor/biotin-[acetyl-CoA-carboxylase] ligase